VFLGLHVGQQSVDLLRHAVELVTQVAEFVAAVQVEQRARLAFGNGGGVGLELVDGAHQAPVQDQQQDGPAQHHLQADDGADLRATVADQALGGAVVERHVERAQHQPVAPDGGGQAHHRPVGGAFAQLDFLGPPGAPPAG
jgi:hypothetical protein